MSLQNILSHLSKVKKNPRGYTACCPVHNDKNPSMSICETDDGKVLAHCFGCGARGVDVVEALGLSTSELFSQPMDRPYDASYKVRKHKLEDEMVMSIYESDKQNGKYLTHADYKRYKLARSRLDTNSDGL